MPERPLVKILACLPVDEQQRQRVRNLVKDGRLPAVVAGSIPIACHDCGMKVWLGPRQQKWRGDTLALCLWCITVRMQFAGEVKTIGLGNPESHLEAPTMKHIFVFGSNLAGRHGKGAALTALKEFKAVYGQGEGLQGDSYAIPTKDRHLSPLPLDRILVSVMKFVEFARAHPELTFRVTRIGCGLAGYKDEHIAPMFANATENVHLPEDWREIARRIAILKLQFPDLT